LFQEANTSSIAHTVSADFDMYNGLHREFVLNFQQTDQKALKEKSKCFFFVTFNTDKTKAL